jgi:hypothetical protein
VKSEARPNSAAATKPFILFFMVASSFFRQLGFRRSRANESVAPTKPGALLVCLGFAG